jgi:MoCo/4Fe-4S cofactor protein with predicted Tat translocation signal
MSDHRSKIEGETGPEASNGSAAAGFVPITDLSPSHVTHGHSSQPLDLAAIRERLAGARGRQYWQSLEELADTEAFREYLEREFPHQAPRDMEPLSRRAFLKVMGASLALAGVSGCAWQPAEKIVPYVNQPEEIVPGKPLFFATAFPRSGYAMGVVAESQMGRPVKIEGNTQHPASLGATDAFAQASVLGLYDPDRSQAVRYLSDPTTWSVLLGEMTNRLDALRRTRGAGLRVLTETITSPTLAVQLRRLLARYPGAKLCQYDPVGQANVREGARLAFGDEVHPVYHFDRAERVLSLDANFLLEEPGSVRYARDFVGGRRVRAGQTRMNRLYVVESTPTITGSYADHRLPLRPSQIEPFARAVAAAIGAGGAGESASPPAVPPEWISAVAKDLQAHRGASLVIAGPHQPPSLHALAHAMNQALGNIGKTVTFTEPVEVHFGPREGTLRELTDDLKAGRVELLVVLGGNPVYTAPADLEFGAVLQQVGQPRPGGQGPATLLVHLGLYDDETGVLCHWHVSETHYLEAWGDVRAYDGTTSIVQPLIAPLYASKSGHEVLAVLLGEGDRYGYDIVRDTWKKRFPAAQFEAQWHQALVKGVIPGTAAPAKTVTVKPGLAAAGGSPPAASGMEIVFRPDPTVWDGRYANNAWLQELPKPLTQLTWDNAALISPATGKAQNLSSEDVIELSYGGRKLRAAVWLTPGQPDETVTLSLGYGRTHAGKLGTGNGFNAYALRTAEAPWFGSGLEVRKVGGVYKLANTQRYFNQYGRKLVRSGTIDEVNADPKSPEFMREEGEEKYPSLYPQMWPSDDEKNAPEAAPLSGRHGPRAGGGQAGGSPEAGGGTAAGGTGEYPDRGYNNNAIPAWGMVIDNNACIGCNACVLACQSENNIATVGKDQVLMHRQMHWIRIDTYYSGGMENPETLFAPIPCMHCEKAPCEPVCPVEATSHSAEGLNEQTYNRCVGTRYCQNNCPYKVRRFNFLQYSDQKTPTIQMMRNPDVTVRSRGVMEKCTYCVQRINEARIQAEKEDREIRDGDIVPACAQACPTQAIIFGNINDAASNSGSGSRVRQLKQEPLNYGILTELNTRPRTSYLAKLRNPNPDLKA